MRSEELTETVFDSHRFVKRLTGAGMEEPVAEVLAEEHVGLLTGNLATKTALAATEHRIRADLDTRLAELRADLDTRLAELRADLGKWMFGALLAQTALLIAVVKLLP